MTSILSELLLANQEIRRKLLYKLERIKNEQKLLSCLSTLLRSALLVGDVESHHMNSVHQTRETELLYFSSDESCVSVVLPIDVSRKRGRPLCSSTEQSTVCNVLDGSDTENNNSIDNAIKRDLHDNVDVCEEWKVRKMRRKATFSKWSHVASRVLMHYISFHHLNVFAPFELNRWQCVELELHNSGFCAFNAIDCYRQGQHLSSSMQIFTRSEDALLIKLFYELGKQWWRVSAQLASHTKRKRTPFQLACRYRDVMRSTFIEKRLSLDAVWERIRPHLGSNENDYYRVCVCVNNDCQDGEMLLSPVTIRRVIEYNTIVKMDKSALFWKVFAILCNIDYPYKNKLHIFAARAPTRYSQLSHAEAAKLNNVSSREIRQCIQNYLLRVCRRLDTLNYEKISIDLFGHQNCALLVFQEACELQSSNVVK